MTATASLIYGIPVRTQLQNTNTNSPLGPTHSFGVHLTGYWAFNVEQQDEWVSAENFLLKLLRLHRWGTEMNNRFVTHKSSFT